VLGGWLIEHGSWRSAFFINLPLGLIVVILALWKDPESRAADASAVADWPGAQLATLGLGGIVFALIQSALIAGIVGALALIGFLYWEAHTAFPMVPSELFRSADFTGANLHYSSIPGWAACWSSFP
jgi:hypothetical protein